MNSADGHYRKLAGYNTFVFGMLSLVLYSTLFWWSEPLIRLSAQGGYYFAIPVSIALIFSYIHGAFTSAFWEWLGIRAKK